MAHLTGTCSTCRIARQVFDRNRIYGSLVCYSQDYNLTQWGWIELDYSYRLIVDVMTPSCG